MRPPSVSDVSVYAVFIVLRGKDEDEEEIYSSGFAVVLPVFCVNGDLRENYTVPAFMEVKLKVGQVISCCVSPVSIRYWRVCNLYCLGPKDEDEEELLVKQLCCCFACLCENYTILAFKVVLMLCVPIVIRCRKMCSALKDKKRRRVAVVFFCSSVNGRLIKKNLGTQSFGCERSLRGKSWTTASVTCVIAN